MAFKGPYVFSGLVFLSLLVAACGGGGDGQDEALVSMSGDLCGTAQDYVLDSGGAVLDVYANASGDLEALVVHDGPVFDAENQAEWQAYAAEYDVMFILAFSSPEPATPHDVTSIFDSFFVERSVGGMAFVEGGQGERVTIESIDMDARTIEVSFDIPVVAYWTDYPPDLAQEPQLCEPPSAVSGTIAGSFELITQ